MVAITAVAPVTSGARQRAAACRLQQLLVPSEKVGECIDLATAHHRHETFPALTHTRFLLFALLLCMARPLLLTCTRARTCVLLGIAAVAYWFGTLDYREVFAQAQSVIGGGYLRAVPK